MLKNLLINIFKPKTPIVIHFHFTDCDNWADGFLCKDIITLYEGYIPNIGDIIDTKFEPSITGEFKVFKINWDCVNKIIFIRVKSDKTLKQMTDIYQLYNGCDYLRRIRKYDIRLD